MRNELWNANRFLIPYVWYVRKSHVEANTLKVTVSDNKRYNKPTPVWSAGFQKVSFICVTELPRLQSKDKLLVKLLYKNGYVQNKGSLIKCLYMHLETREGFLYLISPFKVQKWPTNSTETMLMFVRRAFEQNILTDERVVVQILFHKLITYSFYWVSGGSNYPGKLNSHPPRISGSVMYIMICPPVRHDLIYQL
jgi:hypothetical protein